MKEQLEVHAAYKRALALEELVPDIFQHGTVKILYSSAPSHAWPHDWKMLVTMGNGDQVEVELQNMIIFGEENEWIDILKPEGAIRNPVYLDNGKVIK